ncbi:MAG: cytochrome c [Gammaproteobacteria bacterium]|nr:cytochrome c [Gammaproteobacteria bacterium]
MRISSVLFVVACITFVAMSACSDNTESAGARKIKPVFDRQKVDKGFVIYSAHCQKCHGVNAVGAENWRESDASGKFPPPPLNGTGHAWHHPTKVLKEVIENGTLPNGNMPAWRDKLSEQDIDNVITWFQSLWPMQVYHAWQDINDRQ